MNGAEQEREPGPEPLPGPAIAALLRHLAGYEIELAVLAEDHGVVWTEVDTLPDGAGGEITPDDPPVIGIHFITPDEGSDKWLVVLETPIITSLGELGLMLDAIPASEDTGWSFEVDEGAAMLHLQQALPMAPDDGFELGCEVYQGFLELVEDLGPTGLRFAGGQEEQAGARTPGFWELAQGEAAFYDGRRDDAERLCAAARDHFDRAGLAMPRLVAEAMLGVLLFYRGNSTDALRLLEQCAAGLPDAAACDDTEAGLKAQIFAVIGMAHLAGGRPEQADASFAEAEACGGVEGMGLMRDMSRLRSPLVASEMASELQSDDYLASLGGDPREAAEACVRLSIHHRRLGDFAKAAELVEAANGYYTESGDSSERFGLLGDLCLLRLALNDRQGAQLAFVELKTLQMDATFPAAIRDRHLAILGKAVGDPTFGSVTEPPRSEVEDMFFLNPIDLLARGFEIVEHGTPDDEIRLLEEVVQKLESADDPMGVAMASKILARLRLGTTVQRFHPDRWGQPGSHPDDLQQQFTLGLDECLEAIQLHDRSRHRLGDVRDRSRYTAQILDTYELALLFGCDLRHTDSALVAELLLRVRAVGLPDRKGTTIAGLFPVAEPVHASVAGRSRLAPAGAPTVSLEHRVAAQAGPGSWWWSMWQGTDFVFWATASPDGDLDAGAVALDPERMAGNLRSHLPRPFAALLNRIHFHHGPLGQHLDRLRRDLSVGGDQQVSPNTAMVGLLGTGHVAEPETLLALGELLVPPPLQRALRSATRSKPIRILYEPAPSLSWLPLNLLAVNTGAGRKPIRLLERAVLQAAVPLAELPPLPPRRAASGLLAIIDPENDLPDLHPLADRATVVLSGPDLQTKLGERSLGVATRGRALAAFADGDRYRTLLYAGHARSGTRADPLSGGFGLGIGADRSVLTVADLVEHAPHLHLPEQAVLCGCSTGADRSPPETERWGLAAALSLARCRSIVVTTWDLVSCPSTTRFVDRLLAEMTSGDLPAALRRVQLEMLDQWHDDIAAGNTDFDLSSASCHHPYLWASFVVINRKQT